MWGLSYLRELIIHIVQIELRLIATSRILQEEDYDVMMWKHWCLIDHMLSQNLFYIYKWSIKKELVTRVLNEWVLTTKRYFKNIYDFFFLTFIQQMMPFSAPIKHLNLIYDLLFRSASPALFFSAPLQSKRWFLSLVLSLRFNWACCSARIADSECCTSVYRVSG